MHKNTLKTTIGFCKAFIQRRTASGQPSSVLADIYNYLDIPTLFATSGQPSEAQFQLMQQAGYDTVINLAPNSVLENAVVNERAVLTRLGMKYIHLPVNFQKPTDADFADFVRSLEENADRKVWVHCAANMRVSAFTYRYRRSVLGVDAAVAKADMQKIWEPIGVWKRFVER